MSASKNTELIAKYVWTLFSAISFGLRNSVLVAYSTNPTTASRSVRPTISNRHRRSSADVHRSLRSRQNSNAKGT